MSKMEKLTENARIQDLEQQVEHLTHQLRDYQQVKEQLAEAQKRVTLASLSGGIAHDFNNILHCILGCTEAALSEKTSGSTDVEVLKQIQAIVEKGKDLAQRFLIFGRKSSSKKDNLSFNTLVEDVGYLLRHTTPRNIQIEHKLDSELSFVYGNASQCEQIIMNLCVNAKDAMPYGGKLVIETENIHVLQNSPLHTRQGITPGVYVHISISDTGTGMSEHVLENIFEPFFTTKERGRGAGLGLSIVSSNVKNHGGYIDCTSLPGSGSRFDIYFPVANGEYVPVEPQQEHSFPGTLRGGEVVLFVEDEEAIMNVGKHFLERNGYDVLTTGSCEKALEIYENNTVDLVIMDVGLPGMGGLGLLKNLQSINDEVKVLAISGYPAYSETVSALELSEREFLQKPFSGKELIKRVQLLLDSDTIPIVQTGCQDNLRE